NEMATNYKSGVTGGGASNYVCPPVKAGSPQTRVVLPDAASNIGRSIGNHISGTEGGGATVTQRPNVPLYQPTPAAARMGNDVALNVGRGGPGVGRVVRDCGSQGQWGPVAPGNPRAPDRRK